MRIVHLSVMLFHFPGIKIIKSSVAAFVFLQFSGNLMAQNKDFVIENFPGQQSKLKAALEHLAQGDNYYFDEMNPYYKLALPHYEKANEFNPDNAELNFKLGVCYLNSNHKFRAQPLLEKAYRLNPAVNPQALYQIGLSRHVNGEWDKALESYHQFAQLQLSNEDRKRVNKRIQECNSGKELSAKPVKVKIETLGDAINTSFPEYVPLITADESRLYFTSKRKDTYGGGIDLKDAEYFEDLYYSENINGKWSLARNIGPPLNSKTHDAGAGLSPDGHTLFIYKGDVSNGDIFISYYVNGKWTKPEDAGGNINTKYHESAACLSPDGNMLYFVSDKPGGYGGRDIYRSKWDEQGKKWMQAQNLGPEINTPYDEEGVFMHPDGKTLYFSSQGWNSIGGYDVFYSVSEGRKWSAPVNIGYPVNTPDDDVFFVVSASGEHAYYSSFKKDGKGEKDIYLITFEPDSKPVSEMTVLKGVIRDAATQEPITARIEVIDLSKSEHIGNFYSDKITGKYLVSLPAGRKYGIIAYADGYLFESDNFEIPEKSAFQEVVMNVEMKPMKEGFNMVLTNIFFDTDKYTIKSESKDVLDRLSKLLKENKSIKIEISGHTDSQGSDEHNMTLSDNRAKAVVEYLVNSGIDSSRMSAAGYGETKPIASNDTPEGRQKNRRIEFKITGK